MIIFVTIIICILINIIAGTDRKLFLEAQSELKQAKSVIRKCRNYQLAHDYPDKSTREKIVTAFYYKDMQEALNEWYGR